MENAGTSYLQHARLLFAYYRSLGEKALDQVQENQINWQLARMLKGPDWQSLSIPRGGSADFNREKMQ